MNTVDPKTPTAAPTATDDTGTLNRIAHISLSRLTASGVAGGDGEPTRGTLLAGFVGGVLGTVARVLSPEFVEASLRFARNTGHLAVLAGGALTLLYAIFGAIKYNSFGLFLTGLGILAGIAIAQFTATRFQAAGEKAIANTPSRVSSPAFLECAGLLVLLLGAGVFITGAVGAIRLGSLVPLMPALLLAATLIYVGAVALHPRLVNVESGEGTAGEEAIGLLAFAAKAALKLVPLFFCLLAVGGCVAIVASFFEAGQGLAAMIASVTQLVPLPIDAPYGLAAAMVVLMACLLPLAAYFLFLMQYLFVDVLRAILSVPGKLDALRTRTP
jgi:hypothetical protein